jgi:APA family basic amino acid/polyamine antiporter
MKIIVLKLITYFKGDGLIFSKFGHISERFKTPVFGTLCAALLTSCFAALLELSALVNMLSIGVLLAYTVVAISIIVLRCVSFERNTRMKSDD